MQWLKAVKKWINTEAVHQESIKAEFPITLDKFASDLTREQTNDSDKVELMTAKSTLIDGPNEGYPLDKAG